MNSVFYAALLGACEGVAGTAAGALLICLIGEVGQRFSSALLGFSGGLILAIVFWDMLPESYEAAGLIPMLLFGGGGAAAMFAANRLIPHTHGEEPFPDAKLIKSGMLLAVGIGIHNLPEGIALGSGYVANASFGIALAVLLLIHNIPEGMSLAVPLKMGGVKKRFIVLTAALTGVPLIAGTLAGAAIGSVSLLFMGASLAFGAGAMLYLTFSELFPHAAFLHTKKNTLLWAAAGVAAGCALVLLLDRAFDAGTAF